MLVIRLSRTGKKGERKFRIVVKERRSKRDGASIENLGWYVKGAEAKPSSPASEADRRGKIGLTINRERLNYWLRVGAKASPTVSKILKS